MLHLLARLAIPLASQTAKARTITGKNWEITTTLAIPIPKTAV